MKICQIVKPIYDFGKGKNSCFSIRNKDMLKVVLAQRQLKIYNATTLIFKNTFFV